MNYQIIFLNGPTSSGKTTLGKALQKALPQPFLLLSIDMLIEAMPPQINDWTGKKPAAGYFFEKVTDQNGIDRFKLGIGPYAQKILPAFQQLIVVLASQGFNLIIDDVALGQNQISAYRQVLKNFSILWVGIKIPLAVLEEREKARGDRLVGSARDQYDRVHEGVVYDLELDTSQLSVDEAVNQIHAML